MLIEPYANSEGGHHQRAPVALAQGRPGSPVIAPHGIGHETVMPPARNRRSTGERPGRASGSRPDLISPYGRALQRRAANVPLAPMAPPPAAAAAPGRPLACCLAEAWAQRAARRLQRGAEAVVILTASAALNGAAALVGRQLHLWLVNEQVTTEDAAV
ncbi:hypothetical protein ABT272_42985 [Streptomyces sp900105245]|uniref:Uncharacterized protein n=1 Tax=Streptomyces sp. 900105245 TaxID=3154379 RepID=A0ABV1UKU5_9ACTN